MGSSLKQPILLDVVGLFSAGLINTFLAPLFAIYIFGPGTQAYQPELLQRVTWIAENAMRWKSGWFFWIAVTLSFAWSFYALAHHLNNDRPWSSLAIGLAVIAAAVDLIGVLVNITILPEIAQTLIALPIGSDSTLLAIFKSLETFSYALINITAFGLYSFAGVLLIPVMFATKAYPRWLAWLGSGEWSIAIIATALLLIAPDLSTVPLLISFALFAPWVWASALWLIRRNQAIL